MRLQINCISLSRNPHPKRSRYHKDPNWYFWLGKQDEPSLANPGRLLRSMIPSPSLPHAPQPPNSGSARDKKNQKLGRAVQQSTRPSRCSGGRASVVGLPAPSPGAHPKQQARAGGGMGGGEPRDAPSRMAGARWTRPARLPSPPPPTSSQEGGVRHPPKALPGSRRRGCRTRARTARGSCAAQSRRRPGGKRSPRRGPSAHSTR